MDETSRTMKYQRPSKKAVRRKAARSPLEGQTNLNGRELPELSLRDKIPPSVHTLFVGINPAERSAQVGHYYAHPSNYFWKLFHASGLWPRRIEASEDDLIMARGFGLTDVAKRPTPGVAHLTKSDFFQSKQRINRIVRKHKPTTVVFVGLMAVRAYLGDNSLKAEYGLQKWKIIEAEVFLLPSTSGASVGHTSYAKKLLYFKQLAAHIGPRLAKPSMPLPDVSTASGFPGAH